VSPTVRRYHMISWVARRYSIHPQTLRLYEREGLLSPARSEGNTRLYDDDACDRLEFILTLTRDMGVNLAGVANRRAPGRGDEVERDH
jgi:MerR family transcriptional regulator/heat shock protein HspR